MLKPLLEKKARRRNGDFNPYYGMLAASRLPPYEYQTFIRLELRLLNSATEYLGAGEHSATTNESF